MSELTGEALETYTSWYGLFKEYLADQHRHMPDVFIMRLGEGKTGRDVERDMLAGLGSETVVKSEGNPDGTFVIIPMQALAPLISREVISSLGSPMELFSRSPTESISAGLVRVLRRITASGNGQFVITILGATRVQKISFDNTMNNTVSRKDVVMFTIETSDGKVWYAAVEIKRAADGKEYVDDTVPALTELSEDHNPGVIKGCFERSNDSVIENKEPEGYT